MKSGILRLAIGYLVAVVFAGPAAAGSEEAPDEAKMMEVMQKYAMPGEQHQAMSTMVGHWDWTSTFWMPGAEAQSSKGTAEYATIHDGRYVFETVEGMVMGMPFAGTSIFGYDRFNDEYFTFWIDNMGTGYMTHRGTADATGKVITMEGTHDDFWTGEKDKWSKMVTTITSDDAHSVSMFVKGPDGNEFKTMEISYTRSEMASR